MITSALQWLVILSFIFGSFSCGWCEPQNESKADEERPLVVLICSYNNKRWYKHNLCSVFSQEYSRYRVIYIDDYSEDGTADAVEELVRKEGQGHRVTLIRNSCHLGALMNQYLAIQECQDKEIIVTLDGDDWFYHDRVLSRINAAYASGEVWYTHGSFIHHPGGEGGWSVPIPEGIIKRNAFREYRCPSHVRTFYAWLFKKIRPEDFLYQGQFFEMTCDQAIMFPIAEMAGERHAFISDIIHVYNVANSINDNKVNAKLQMDLEAYIRNMPRYLRLETAGGD